MIVFPFCKINLGLHILNKREDGYHNLETVFYPVPLNDALEILPSGDDSPLVTFTQSGKKINGSVDENLCVKAYHLLKKDYPSLPAINMHLHKNIPMGAGLGGGSANAAFTLIVLNSLFKLQLSTNQLIEYALQLGSDCPFFITGTPSLGTSRGELLAPVALSLSSYKIILINPGIHVHTGQAFASLRFSKQKSCAGSLTNIINQPIDKWKNLLKNDFEQPVFKQYPLLASIKETLYQQGAVYAAMTGSGSTLFGLFAKDNPVVPTFNEKYFSATLPLQ